MFENVKWIFVQEVQVGPFWFEEYLSEDETLVKKVWYDGEIEIFKCGQYHNKVLSNCIQLFVLDYRMKLQYNIIKKSKGVYTMMERSRRNRKFSFKYRVEKWFYEDSKNDCKKAGIAIMEIISLLMMFGMIAIIPALFH